MSPQYIVHRNIGHEENPVSVKNYQRIKLNVCVLVTLLYVYSSYTQYILMCYLKN